MATGVKVPRNFKLLGELDDVEHGGGVSESHIGFISFGLARPDDTFLTDWNASIIGPQNTPLGDRIFTLQVASGSASEPHQLHVLMDSFTTTGQVRRELPR
eukprot:scaffold1472_cov300-Pinguiococcus_pyrenoidosus.AAC.12